MSITSRVATPAPAAPTFPGLFRSTIGPSVWLMSSPTEGIRVVAGRHPVLDAVGTKFAGKAGTMEDRVRRGHSEQIHTPFTVEFNPVS